MSFTLIENSKDLGFLDKELIEKPYIGIDTEFRRRSKYKNSSRAKLDPTNLLRFLICIILLNK